MSSHQESTSHVTSISDSFLDFIIKSESCTFLIILKQYDHHKHKSFLESRNRREKELKGLKVTRRKDQEQNFNSVIHHKSKNLVVLGLKP